MSLNPTNSYEALPLAGATKINFTFKPTTNLIGQVLLFQSGVVLPINAFGWQAPNSYLVDGALLQVIFEPHASTNPTNVNAGYSTNGFYCAYAPWLPSYPDNVFPADYQTWIYTNPITVDPDFADAMFQAGSVATITLGGVLGYVTAPPAGLYAYFGGQNFLVTGATPNGALKLEWLNVFGGAAYPSVADPSGGYSFGYSIADLPVGAQLQVTDVTTGNTFIAVVTAQSTYLTLQTATLQITKPDGASKSWMINFPTSNLSAYSLQLSATPLPPGYQDLPSFAKGTCSMTQTICGAGGGDSYLCSQGIGNFLFSGGLGMTGRFVASSAEASTFDQVAGSLVTLPYGSTYQYQASANVPGAPVTNYEIWDKTSNADARVGDQGLTGPRSITVSVGDQVVSKQTAGSQLLDGTVVDVYWNGTEVKDSPQTVVNGYWELNGTITPEQAGSTNQAYTKVTAPGAAPVITDIINVIVNPV